MQGFENDIPLHSTSPRVGEPNLKRLPWIAVRLLAGEDTWRYNWPKQLVSCGHSLLLGGTR